MVAMAGKPGPFALGFDIGGTNTKVGLVNLSGEVSAFRSFPTDARGTSPTHFLSRLVENLEAVLDQARGEVIGIGASVHGWTDDARLGPILCVNTPALHGVNLKQHLVDAFNRRVVVNNDLTAHVLAEYTYGTGRGVRRFLCLALGTGLGAGVVVDGKPLRFVGGCAGDTGHIILEPGGPACSTGCRGCAEALCGIGGIERLARDIYGDHVDAHTVIAAARDSSDTRAVEVMTRIGHYVGQALASLSVIFLPDRIALSGGTAETGDVLLRAVCERFDTLVGDYHRTYAGMSGDYYNGVEIVLGKMRGETGVVGSVVELFEPYLHGTVQEARGGHV